MKKALVLLLLSAIIAGARHLDVTTSTWSTRLSAAVAGDTLHLADGTYSIISPSQDGTLNAPIVVQGTSRTATILAGGGEGFVWYPKHWVWENIWFRGDGSNYHLFHVKGTARGYLTWRNCHFSGVADKAIKIDHSYYTGPQVVFPDYVLMENCSQDLGYGGFMNNDGSDFLTCRGNYTYHHLSGGGEVLHLYFTKGGNAYTVFENNIAVGGAWIYSFGGGTMYSLWTKWRHDEETWGATNTPKPGTTGNYDYKEVETYRSICRNNIAINATISALASQATIDCEFYNNTIINCTGMLAKEFQNGRATNLRVYNNLTINGGDDLYVSYDGYSDGIVCIAEHNKALGTRTLSDIFVSVNTTDYSQSDWHLKSSAIATQIGTGIAPYAHPTWPAYYSLLGSGNYDFYGAQHSNPPIIGATQVAGTGIEESVASAANGVSVIDVTPNPANPTATLRLSLALDRPIVDILVCDIRGKHVRTLYYGPMESGQRNVAWDGRDHFSRRMASGTYFFRVSLGHDVLMKKFQLVR